MSIPAGRRDQRVEVQAQVAGQDAFGEANGAWTTEVTLWGAVSYLQGTELIAAQRLVAEATIKVEVLWVASMIPQKRLLWDGRTLEVLFVDAGRQRKNELVLLCRELQ